MVLCFNFIRDSCFIKLNLFKSKIIYKFKFELRIMEAPEQVVQPIETKNINQNNV